MTPYLAHVRMTLRLMMRNRGALFFGYVMPLGFFFVFGQMGNAARGGAAQLLTMVLTLGVLGSGFFGTAMYAVMNREQNILRRFKVAPLGPAPMLVASLFASLVNYLPMAVVMIVLANRVYGMPWPTQPLSLLVFVSLGLLAFCSIGNIIAAVVNSMQEATIIAQLFYLPMLLLSGATIPTAMMPEWVQIVSQFLPSTYYSLGLQRIFMGGETLLDIPGSVGALALTVVLGTFLAIKLFRWEKEEKLPGSAKLWLVGVLAPFFIMGVYQAYAKDNIAKSRVLARDLQRNHAWLIQDARIFVGDGTVIERGSVLLRDGKIQAIYTGQSPDGDDLQADEIDAAGKTLLPGLIDVQVHLDMPAISGDGGVTDEDWQRALAAYLYSGVVAVQYVGGDLAHATKHGATIASGERLGAEVFLISATGKAAPVRPPLAMIDTMTALAQGRLEPLERTLVQQVLPRDVLDKARAAAKTVNPSVPLDLAAAKQNLLAMFQSGTMLAVGTSSGTPMLVHGPAIHRELQLWVEAGVPHAAALQAATYNAAKLMGAESRIGSVKQGFDATLLLVDGNPLTDISSTERISSVFFKGERINRAQLFDQK